MHFSLLALTVAIAASTANATCPRSESPGMLQICKDNGKKNCHRVSSGNACRNLDDGYSSGYSWGDYSCTVYQSRNCHGEYISVDHDGWDHFKYKVYSYKCPCVEKE